MNATLMAAAVMAVAVSVGSVTVRAADLDYDDVPPPDRHSSAYEDPRYRDLYGPEPRRDYRFDPRPLPPVPPAYVYRDLPPPHRVGEWERRRDWREREACVPRHVIERRLSDEGWGEFHALDLGPGAAHVNARRPNGDLYRLKVDRCSGLLIRADLVEPAHARPFAFRDGPRRFERPIY
jgi:hypothetical protein